MADPNSSGSALLNIAPGRQMRFKTVDKPEKTNPYIEPPVFKNNFINTPRVAPVQANQVMPKVGNEPPARTSMPQPTTLHTHESADYADLTRRRGTPERQSLLKETPSQDMSFAAAQDDEQDIGFEEEPESYAVFNEDMSKIKKFKEDYDGTFEKDKELDRKITVQQVKLDQLVDHSNELVDKKEEFKQALTEIMKENARLDHRNDELLEDIKELEDAIEKGIKLVNDDEEEDEKNLNLFMVGDPTKLHEMKIDRERRKLKRALINALDYMEGKESRLTGIKEHRSFWQKVWDKIKAFYKFIVPLKNDITRVRRSYDKSIESFFELFRFLVNFNILTAFGFAYILIMHVFDFNGSFSSLWATYFPCFLQYSRFSSDSKLRYSFALSIFVVLGVFLWIYKWVRVDYKAKKQRYFNRDENYFAREFFNSWDFRTKRIPDGKQAVKGVQTILKVMLFEEKKKELVKQLTRSDKWRIWSIRASLIALSILILILGWIVIILASFYEDNITSYCKNIPVVEHISKYIGAIVLTIVNYIVPKCLGWITECEKWDFAVDQLKQEIWRNYCSQMLNFFIFVFIHLELLLSDPIFRSDYIIDVSEQNKDSVQYDCAEDFVGLAIFKLFIVELIQRYVYYFGWIIYYRVKAKCQRLNNWRKEFETTDEVVWLIYFQAIMWISFIYYPYLAIIAPIVLYLHFKFIFYRLRNWKISPQLVTNKVTSGNYIMIFLNITFLCWAFAYALFLLEELPHGNWASSTSTLCGPFPNNTKANQPVIDEIDQNSSVASAIKNTIAHPIMLLIVIIYAIFFGYDFDRLSSMYKQYIEDKKKESDQHIDDLKIERSSLNKKLAFLRRQANFN